MSWIWVLGAFAAAYAATSLLGQHVTGFNRRVEGPRNVDIPAPDQGELAWHIVHIRDDMGFLAAGVCVGNGLLAAVLATLLMR